MRKDVFGFHLTRSIGILREVLIDFFGTSPVSTSITKHKALADNCPCPPHHDISEAQYQLTQDAGPVLPALDARFRRCEKWRHEFCEGTD